jgi:hypothetical protein
METKKRKLFGLFCVLALCVLTSKFAQAVEYGADLLSGGGDFEIQGQTNNGIWTVWSGNGSELAGISSTYSHAGIYSWKLGPSSASGKNIRAVANVSTAGNRQHKIVTYVKYAGSSPSYSRIQLGNSEWSSSMNLTWASSYFYGNTKYYTTENSETAPVLCIAMYSNSANDTIYMDDIAVYRERCKPMPVSDSLDGILPGTSGAVTVSIYCDPCSDGTYNYRFDPDITVESTEAILNSVTWVNDQQIDVNLTVTCQDENVEFFLKNQYSDLYAYYVMEVDNYGADLLNGAGSFEFDGNDGPWSQWPGSNEPAGISSTYANSGTYSYVLGPATASGKNIRAEMTLDNMAPNRTYKIKSYARIAGSSPSWVKVRLGSDSLNDVYNLSYAWTSFTENTSYTVYDENSTSAFLTLALYSNSASDTVYLDDIAVYRRRAIPDPNWDSLGGDISYNQRVSFTIGGDVNDCNYYFAQGFDPDITVTSDQAEVHSVTWISDTEIQVDLTVTDGNDDTLALTLTNQYSNLSTVYKMTVSGYGDDLLGGDGGFEFAGDVGPWVNWPYNGSEFSGVDNAYARTGLYSWKFGPTSTSGKNVRCSISVDTIMNRKYKVTAYTMYETSSPSYTRIKLGDDSWDSTLNLAMGNLVFKGATKYFTAVSNVSDLWLALYSNSANDTTYVDDIAVYVERCVPKAAADSASGVINYGQQSSLYIYCDCNQTIGNLNCKFDPDIEVTSNQATISSCTWVSDTEIAVTLIPTCNDDNDVILNLHNINSGLKSSYTLKNKYGADILVGSGDFDDPNASAAIGDRTEWITTADSGVTAGFTTSKSQSASWAWKSLSSSASVGAVLNNRVDIMTAANRLHELKCNIYSETSSTSLFTAKIGSDSARSMSMALGSWISNSITYTTSLNENAIDLVFDMDADSANDTVYLDNVTLRRERCRPNPQSDSLGGVLPYEESTVVLIYGTNGTNGSVKLAFDPDVKVYSDNAVINSVTWVSDTQIDVNLTAFYGGNILLKIENTYSELSATYTMSSTIPSGHFSTSSDEFPIILYDAGTSESSMELARTCGFTYTHRFSHCGAADVNDAINELLDYMDLSQQYGMHLLVYLKLDDWIDDANCATRMETIVNAVKDHNAMGFWHLEDEPECQSVAHQALEIQSFYTLVKTISPNVPVAITHSQKSQPDGRDWWDFYNCEDIFVTDRYPIYDKPFPFAAADSATNWFQTAYNTSHGSHGDFVMPSLQLLNRLAFPIGTWPEITADCRYPNATEVRYWAYATIIQGARGLGWYSYKNSIIPDGIDGDKSETWLKEVFKPVGQEIRRFVYLTKPVHEPSVILDGSSTDNYLFMAHWLRTNDDWLVLVNGRSEDRTVTIDMTGYYSDAELEPWGLSRNVVDNISDSQLTIHLGPWEVLIWKIKQ